MMQNQASTPDIKQRYRRPLWFALGFMIYGITMYGLMRFYKDDPTQMLWDDREAYNARYIQRLDRHHGVTQPQVIAYLGGPDITEARRLNDRVYQILWYRTHRDIADGITTAQECTALLFIDQQLVAIGPDALLRYRQLPAHPISPS
jgi:hypothetical protein